MPTPLTVWNWDGLEHEHEKRAAKRLLEILRGFTVTGEVNVAFGFRVPGAEIDCVVAAPGGLLIAELKEWHYHVQGRMNGPWLRRESGGSLVQMRSEKSPYQQVLVQRSKLAATLKNFEARRNRGMPANAGRFIDRIHDLIAAGLVQCPRKDSDIEIDEPWWFADGLESIGGRLERLLKKQPQLPHDWFAAFLASIGCRRQDAPEAAVLAVAPPCEPVMPPAEPAATPRRRGVGVDLPIQEAASVLSNHECKAVEEEPANANLVVCAGPGAGKTEFLARRIRFLAAQHPGKRKIVAVSYTNAASKELLERVHEAEVGGPMADRVQGGTVHSFARSLLLASGGPWKQCRILSGRSEAKVASRFLATCGGDFAAMKTEDLLGATRQRNDPLPIETRQSDAVAAWCDYMRLRDCTGLAAMMLHASDAVATLDAAALPAAVVIDEYQDITGPQLALLKSLSRRGIPITGVGDPEQAIYSFADAFAGAFTDFPRRFPAAKQCRLSFNWRSATRVRVASARLRRDGLAQTGVRIGEGAVRLDRFPSVRKQAENIARTIGDLAGLESASARYRFSQVAVLLRTKRNAEEICEEFDALKLPYRLSFGEEPLSEGLLLWQPACAAALAATVEDAADHLDGVQALAPDAARAASRLGADQPAWRLFEAMVRDARNPRVVTAATAILELARTASPHPLQCLPQLLSVFDNVAVPFLSPFHGANAVEAERAAISLYSTAAPSLADMVESLGWGRMITPDLEADEIAISTIHQAKGMQWPVVFVPTLTEGILPSSMSKDIDEERRLLYVAMTRAKVDLRLSWVEHTGDCTGPSRFLRELGYL